MHPKHKIYVPELIFSHLLTSTSYDSSKISTAAGTHGLGAKLTNVYSKKFEVENETEEHETVFLLNRNSGGWRRPEQILRGRRSQVAGEAATQCPSPSLAWRTRV